MAEDLPLTAFRCPEDDAAYAVHSKEKGLISCHLSEGEKPSTLSLNTPLVFLTLTL